MITFQVIMTVVVEKRGTAFVNKNINDTALQLIKSQTLCEAHVSNNANF